MLGHMKGDNVRADSDIATWKKKTKNMERVDIEVDLKEKRILEETSDLRNKNETNAKIVGEIKNIVERTLEELKDMQKCLKNNYIIVDEMLQDLDTDKKGRL